MFQTIQITAATITATNTQATKSEPTVAVVTTVRDATKDAGRVHVGGGMMRF